MSNELNLNKLIIKTAIITLSVIVITFFSLIGVFTLVNPKLMAKMSSSLQINNAAIYYYELTYKKTHDRNDLYILLNEAIKQNKLEKITTFFEEFFENGSEEYYDFIEYINNYYMEKTQDSIYKAYLVNEDARLKSKYITALLEKNETNKAFEFLIDDLQNEVFLSIDDYDKLNFIANAYVSYLIKQNAPTTDYEKFINYTYKNELVNYLQQALNYYNNMKQIYDISYYIRVEYENSFKLYVVANHLFEVANIICVIDEKVNDGIYSENLQNDIAEFVVHLNTLEQELS